ncbi:MAG: RES family NAD+ phosphorylase [Armatimonadota bacterium]
MGCCANCFGDSFLQRQIAKDSNGTGNCSYCTAVNVPLVEPIVLRDLFELLLGAYVEDPDGKKLVDWFKSDWSLFDSLSVSQSKDLLSEILDDGEIVRKHFRPNIADDGSSLERWHKFREELKHENRYFPQNIPDLERLGVLLEGHLGSEPDATPDILYRARLMEGDCPYPPDKMGRPPKELSTHGRANPSGIPYLYLASDIRTAIAELRPHKGEKVCVAEFRVVGKPIFVDLRNPRKTISPFPLSDGGAISLLRKDISFLCQLGEELTRPVLPRAAHLEYLSSQYLCEFIKRRGFDGVMYRSSVEAGVNYAIFDESSTDIGAIRQYQITRVSVDIAEDIGAAAPSDLQIAEAIV